MARTRTMIVKIMMALVALMFASCDADRFNGVTDEDDPQTLVNPLGEPEDSTHVTLRDSTGRILETGFNLGKYAEVQVEETKHANAKEAWKPAEKLAKSVAESAETTFRYNHGDNTVATKVVLVVKQDYYKDLGDGRVIRLKKGDIIPLWRPEKLNLQGGEPAKEETTGRLYYAETAVTYSLRYDKIVLAEGVQNFVAEEGYVPAVIGNKMLDHRHINGWAGKLNGNKLPIYCNNQQLFAKMWDNGTTLSDSTWVAYQCLNSFVLDLHEVKTNDFSQMQKVYNLDANGVTIINGVQQKVVREADASVVGSVKYNGVEYRDSVHKCYYDAKTITLVTTDSADITFVHREGLDKVTKRVAFKTTVVTLKEVLREFIHKVYRKKAIVSGTNVAAICDNDYVFQDLFTDGSKGKEVKGTYIGTNNLTLTMPDAVAREARGKSYNFTVDSQSNGTAAVEGKNVKLTSASWVVGDIMYNGKNYKNDPKVPTCKVVPASIYFRTDCDSVDISLKHDSETITATVIVNYEAEPTPADVDVEIMRISITDAYKDQHKAQEGTYLHIFGKDKNGDYVVLSQRVGDTAFQSTMLSSKDGDAISDCGRAIAYVFNNISNRYQIGTVTSEDGITSKGFYLCYYVAGGGLAYSLGDGTGTEALKDGFRDAIRGSVSKANADGTWTVTADGKTYTFVGL